MRILVVSHNYPRFPGDPAGAFVARIAAGAAAAGHAVQVIAPHTRETPRSETPTTGLRVRRFRYAPEPLERVAYTGDLHRSDWRSPLRIGVLPLFLATFRRTIRQALQEFSPDLIHAHWWLPGGWAAATGRVPLLITSHGSDVRLLERAMFRALARPVFRRAAAITTVSHFLAENVARLLELPQLRPIVAPMPVDDQLFAGGVTAPKADPPRILYAGNLVPSKGVDVLLRAGACLRDRGLAFRLRILGEGPEDASLHALAEQLGIGERVSWSRFLPQDRMPAEYGAATVTVLPTRGQAEGLGLTLVEALLAGSAVVGTPAGGIPEVVQNGQTGLLARDGDAEDLADKLALLLADSPLRSRLTAQGQAAVRAIYGQRQAIERFLELYADITGHHGS